MTNHKNIVKDKTNNSQLRANLANATKVLQANRKKTISTKITDWQGLRDKAKNVKNNALINLKEIILEFEQNATKNGMKVHYANTKEDACKIILSIMQEKNIKKVLKGKSMASEEIELNAYLQKQGITAIETDLGELIIQLLDEKPVHIVGPAMHKNRYEIGEIFEQKLGVKRENDPQKLNAIAREHLRKEFKNLTMGISGVNFAVSSKGAIWLIENEGNGRMCTAASNIHVAICGIEKIVKDFKDAATTNTIIATSSAGQFISVYSNIITSARQENELDGPKEVHIILLNNNRTKILKDKKQYEVLRCIRCGVCLNFCPVYNKIGGHGYKSIYSGPIGVVISPQLFGKENYSHMLSLCSLCGRCADVCPVKIPLPNLIRDLRYKLFKDDKSYEKMIFTKFQEYATNPSKWHKALNIASKSNFFIQAFGGVIPIIKQWKAYKDLPYINSSLHKEIKNIKGIRYE